MGQELDPSPSPATSRAPEERAGVQLVAVAVFFAIMLGAIFFLASASTRTLLSVGLGLFLIELASIIALTATGWQGHVRGTPLLVLALGWLGWNGISGTCLAVYVLASYPSSLLKGILLFVLLFAPIVVTVAVVLLADRVRRWLVSRQVGRT